MSVRAVSWAYGLNLGSMTQKAVLLYLAYRAREEDNCAWPSVNLIQVETELSERAVRKALRELRDKGLIALGDQELAAVDFHGDVVPVNRRPKVWTLRLDASTESFNGVERAEDVQTGIHGKEMSDHDCGDHGMGPGTRARGNATRPKRSCHISHSKLTTMTGRPHGPR